MVGIFDTNFDTNASEQRRIITDKAALESMKNPASMRVQRQDEISRNLLPLYHTRWHEHYITPGAANASRRFDDNRYSASCLPNIMLQGQGHRVLRAARLSPLPVIGVPVLPTMKTARRSISNSSLTGETCIGYITPSHFSQMVCRKTCANDSNIQSNFS